ncbi:VOC family protein [Nocardiopsis sp. NPDC006832]|uniref:VOC family protein n=1 Tax=Nocardiopsis sp. NPDC006832 TaxID=3157188 RepID=UPI0033EB2B57
MGVTLGACWITSESRSPTRPPPPPSTTPSSRPWDTAACSSSGRSSATAPTTPRSGSRPARRTAPPRESHIAFTAADRATVDAFFAAAVEVGAEVLHEPKEWPEYHEHYYGAFVRDPDGNNVEAVSHVPARG